MYAAWQMAQMKIISDRGSTTVSAVKSEDNKHSTHDKPMPEATMAAKQPSEC